MNAGAKQSALIRQPAVRRVFGRVKGVPVDLAVDGPPNPKPHVFELRKDGIWFRRKHSPKWTTIKFAELVAEARRQQAMEKALADARREDPRQMVMFTAAEPEQQHVMNL